ncbi:hypothetical protein [Fusobacterium sp. PH5-44]|uniref:hypothetical protein n=1 Tax=unclassified Fusobacterium TaxID=2648384 RepID=UPI003D1A48EE
MRKILILVLLISSVLMGKWSKWSHYPQRDSSGKIYNYKNWKSEFDKRKDDFSGADADEMAKLLWRKDNITIKNDRNEGVSSIWFSCFAYEKGEVSTYTMFLGLPAGSKIKHKERENPGYVEFQVDDNKIIRIYYFYVIDSPKFELYTGFNHEKEKEYIFCNIFMDKSNDKELIRQLKLGKNLNIKIQMEDSVIETDIPLKGAAKLIKKLEETELKKDVEKGKYRELLWKLREELQKKPPKNAPVIESTEI